MRAPRRERMVGRHATVLVDVRIVRDALTGVGRYLGRMLDEIGRLGPEDLTVTALGRTDQAPLSDVVTMAHLPGRAGRSAPLGLAQHLLVPRTLRNQACDLYHYPNFDVPPVRVPRLVATCYDLEPLRHPELFSTKIVWFYRLLSRRLRRADRIVTISESTARDVHDLLGISRERITAIHLGVDPGFSRAVPDEQDRVRRNFRLPRRFVLYVGNTMPHKNVERLVESMAVVRRTCPEVPLVIGGAPDRHRASVERVVARHRLGDGVRFLGKVADRDLSALLSSASAFAFPSLYEGFGLPVLEAMACGTPVVTSNRSSLPEVVGNAAIMVEPTDVSAIAGGLVTLLEDERESARVAELGVARARHFTWRRCAESHLRVYREVLAT